MIISTFINSSFFICRNTISTINIKSFYSISRHITLARSGSNFYFSPFISLNPSLGPVSFYSTTFRTSSKPWLFYPIHLHDNPDILLSYVLSFLKLLDKDHKYLLLIKVHFNNSYITLNNNSLILSHDYNPNDLVSLIRLGLNKYYDMYHLGNVHEVLFSYCKLNNVVSSNLNSVVLSNPNDKNLLRSSSFPLDFFTPKYMPYYCSDDKFGSFLNTINNPDHSVTHVFQYTKDVLLHRTFIDHNSYKCSVYFHNRILFNFTDFVYKDNFIRVVDSIFMTFNHSGQLIFTEKSVSFNKISSLKKHFKFNDNFLTLDIEAFQNPSDPSNPSSPHTFLPYAIGFYDGSSYQSFYLSDFKSSEHMIVSCFRELLKPKYRNKVIYAHNLSRFDGVFLLKYLVNNFILNPVLKDNQLIALTVSTFPYAPLNGDKSKNAHKKMVRPVSVKILDSYLMLHASLRDLCTVYNVDVQKTDFPHQFVSSANLDYVGDVPSFEYYSHTSHNDYLTYKSQYNVNKWSLKSECLDYLYHDVVSLHQVIKTFANNVWSDWSLNITDYLTLSSLAFAIFRSSYMKDDLLPIIKGNTRWHQLIKGSYYGGSVDVYKPYYENCYYYDVNSLYPYSLLNAMPTGNGKYSTDPDINNWFGFINVNVKCPTNIKNPILPFRKEDGTVIHPTGSWTGCYFSEELKNAINYGYEIKIIDGLKFEKGEKIFDGYVEQLYNIKKNTKGVKAKLAKLLLNSLYGRLGMNDITTELSIVTHEQAQNILTYHEIYEHEPEIGEGLELIKHSKYIKPSLALRKNEDGITLKDLNEKYKVQSNNSLVIASALTAYGRIYMSKFKNMKDNEVIYTDTDSLVLAKPLKSEYISTELGMFKEEYKCKKFYAVNPKVYLIELHNGELIQKVAGAETKLSGKEFEDMINGEKIVINNKIWVRNFNNGTITIVDHPFTIYARHNKRLGIIKTVNNKLKWVDTIPIEVINGVISMNIPQVVEADQVAGTEKTHKVNPEKS